MATASIKVKRSAVAGKIPATTDLDLGEIAINTYDGVAYIKKNVNGTETVVNLGGTVELSQNLQNRYQYTATSNQTTFAATYLAPFVDVFLNGVKLLIGTEYTATNGTSIVLATGASAGSILDIIAYSTYTANANYADLNNSMVVNALGYTPYNATNPSNYITTAGARSAISVTGAGSYNSSTGVINIVGGVTSFNTRTGAISLTSGDVTTALGYTPYDSANPSNYITVAQARGSVSASGSLAYNSSTGVFSYTTPSTSGITEGSNLYYTDSRARGAVSATGSLSYNSTTGVFSYTTPSTSGITEGTNLYYTDARARAAISVAGSGSYNSTTGVITVTGGVTSVNTRTGAVTLTSSDVGLDSVENKSSATIRSELTSSNITTALGFTPENSANRGAANGYASLNSSGQIPSGQLPSYVDDVIEGTNLASFPATGETGKIYVALDTNKTYRWSGSAYVYITSGAVDSVAGRTGVITLTNSDVGLGNVENKSSSTIRSELTSSNVTTALGFTPYNATNPSGYITGITSSNVTTALGFTPYNATNPSGYITSSALSGYLTSATAASTYLPLSGGTLSGILTLVSSGTAINISGQSDSFGYNATSGLGTYIKGTGSTYVYGGGKFFDGSTAQTLLHVGNYTSYSPSLTGSNASGTWGISISGNAATASTVNNTFAPSTSGNLLYATVGTDDFVRIQAGSTGYNAGYLEIATADDGNEPIYVRQYTGVFSSVARTLTLLDGSGNTSIPGSLSIAGNTAIHAGNYSSYALPLTGGTITGLTVWNTQLYFSGINFNTLNSGYGAASDGSDIWLNYRGYNDGFSYFRNFNVGNGKGTAYIYGDGSSQNVGIGTGQSAGARLHVRRGTPSGVQAVNGNATVLLDNTGDNFIQFRNSADNGTYSGLIMSDNNQGGYVVFGNAGAGDLLRLGGYSYISFDVGYDDSTSSVAIKTQRGYIDTSANMFAFGSMRAPIFYDYNDTGYYVNPNSASNFYQKLNIAATGSFNPDTQYGISFGDNAGITGWNFNPNGSPAYRNLTFYATGWNGSSVVTRNILTIGNYNGNVGILTISPDYPLHVAGTAYSSSDFRAPIFYDSDDTTYFSNPSSTTRINRLKVFSNPAADWDAVEIYSTGTSGFIQGLGDESGLYLRSEQGNIYLADNRGDVRMPKFYDVNNTAYYCDPNSTSEFSRLNVAGYSIGSSTTVDLSGNDQSTYYPVAIPIGANQTARIRINVGLNSGSTPSWSTHPAGFTLVMEWESNGNGWGTTPIQRKINGFTYSWSNVNPCGGITQNNNSSLEIVYLRGGGRYHVQVIGQDTTVTAYTSGISSNGITHNPTSSAINNVWDSATGNGVGVSILRANEQVASPIFYDSNDTGYYLSPNTDNRLAYIYANYIGVNQSIDTNWRLIVNGNAYLNSGSYGQAEGSWRAPLFYDSNDTAYYCNPNGKSYLASLNINGASWISFNSEEGSWGIKTRNSDNTTWLGGQLKNQIFCGGGPSEGFSVGGSGTGGASMEVNNAGNMWVKADVRAPILYDLNDTSYYLDANSNSKLRQLTIDGPSSTQLTLRGTEADLWLTSTGSGGTWRILGCTGSSTHLFRVYDQSAGTDRFNINSSGNVYASVDFRAPIFYDNNDTGYYCDPNSTSNLNNVTINGELKAHANPVKVNRINFTNTSGSQASDPYCLRWRSETDGDTGSQSWLELQMNDDAEEEFRIYGYSCSGYGCGQLSSNLYHRFYANGNAWHAGNVTAYSDIRVKDNISIIDNAVDKVMQIRGVTFTRIDRADTERRHAGVIAQEVEVVLPEVVDTDEFGTKSVAYGNMVGLLIEAIKEQQKQIEELKRMIEK
jgi:hypothetical protein